MDLLPIIKKKIIKKFIDMQSLVMTKFVANNYNS